MPTKLMWQAVAAVTMIVPMKAPAQPRPAPVTVPVPLDIRVPKAPMIASVGDRSLLVYELRVTNLGRRDLATSGSTSRATAGPSPFLRVTPS